MFKSFCDELSKSILNLEKSTNKKMYKIQVAEMPYHVLFANHR